MENVAIATKIRIIDDYCSACGAVMDIDLEDTED